MSHVKTKYEVDMKTAYIRALLSLSTETLKTMYSPLFDKRFSEMNIDEIEKQVDIWIEEGGVLEYENEVRRSKGRFTAIS